MTTLTLNDYKLMRTAAGYSYDPARETPEQGAIRAALELARAAYAYRHDPDVYADWTVDTDPIEDLDRSQWICLLYRGENIVAALGSIDLGGESPATSSYARVIEAELYADLEATRELMAERGEN